MHNIKYTKKYNKKNRLSRNISRNISLKNNKKKNNNLLVGCHSSIVPDILTGIKYVESIGGNALQIFLGSKSSASIKMKHKFKNQAEIDEIKNYVSRNKICLVIHSVYPINLCKFPSTSGRIQYAHTNIQYDLKYGQMLGAKCVVLHIGSRTDNDIDTAINNLVSNINKIISNMPKGIMLSLETSAGSGNQVGWNLEELARIWDMVKNNSENKTNSENNKNKVGICIDTAHIFVSGYDISTVAGISEYMNKFNSLIGIKHITNFHINDSKYALGTKHDEHRGIGQGLIYNSDEGKKALLYIKKICMKNKIPMILETHSAGSAISEGSHKGEHGYEYEIDMIKKL
jgi:deoxyribonuclease-4